MKLTELKEADYYRHHPVVDEVYNFMAELYHNDPPPRLAYQNRHKLFRFASHQLNNAYRALVKEFGEPQTVLASYNSEHHHYEWNVDWAPTPQQHQFEFAISLDRIDRKASEVLVEIIYNED